MLPLLTTIAPHTDGGLERVIERASSVMGGTEMFGWFIVAVVGLLGSAFFAGAETGLYMVNRVRLRLRSSRKDPPDHLARVLTGEIDRADRTLPAMLIGFNLFSALTALGLTAILTDLGYTEAGLIWINVLLVTPITFVLADTLPKEVFRAGADRLAYTTAPGVRLWRVLVTITGVLPLVRLMAAGLARIVAKNQADAPEASRQRIASLLKEGAQHGVISPAQLTLLDQAFALREARVGDEMIPWPRALTIDAGWPKAQVIAFIQKHPASRFPLIGDRGPERGLVLGVVEHIDLCTVLETGAGTSLRDLARPAPILSPEMPVRRAMQTLTDARAKIAIVISGTRPVGLVTVKDLIEPLTGEMRAW